MSYSCPGGCPEIQYFSNPDISYNGDPTGIAYPNPGSADNARTINQTRLEMAGYRAEVQPTLTVISPDGGEAWRRGRTYSIVWTSSNLTGSIKIELLKGGSLNTTISQDTPDTGSYSWMIPPSQSLGSNYRIRVSSVESPGIIDDGEADFSISQPLEIKAMPWLPLLVLDD